MFFDLVDTLQKKRRLLFVAGLIAIDFWLLTFCSQTLQAHRSDIANRINNTESSQALPTYQSNVLDIGSITASANHAVSVVEVNTLRTVVAATDGIARAEHGLQTAGKATLRTTATLAAATTRATGQTITFAWQVETFPFVALGHGTKYVFGTAYGLTNKPVAALIQPKNDATVPVITPEQIHQASLIQSGTLEVKQSSPGGTGGACDSGAGNGGYPMDWCNAPMDAIRTVSYSSDRINRECTSYAFWYFTTIEGHTDFHVTGNANRWASTSNYPVHAAPAVGAIAVETAGAYGHVAIVQALPGQTYNGKAVPSGYALVSEMNYDWHGHFRYSYSPLSKFSGYIYP